MADTRVHGGLLLSLFCTQFQAANKKFTRGLPLSFKLRNIFLCDLHKDQADFKIGVCLLSMLSLRVNMAYSKESGEKSPRYGTVGKCHRDAGICLWHTRAVAWCAGGGHGPVYFALVHQPSFSISVQYLRLQQRRGCLGKCLRQCLWTNHEEGIAPFHWKEQKEQV